MLWHNHVSLSRYPSLARHCLPTSPAVRHCPPTPVTVPLPPRLPPTVTVPLTNICRVVLCKLLSRWPKTICLHRNYRFYLNDTMIISFSVLAVWNYLISRIIIKFWYDKFGKYGFRAATPRVGPGDFCLVVGAKYYSLRDRNFDRTPRSPPGGGSWTTLNLWPIVFLGH